MNKHFSLHIQASYDAPVDVLHLVRDVVPHEGDGLPDGVELDYALEDGRPCGVKVIGFHKNGWDFKPSQLAKIVSQHLQWNENDISVLIKEAVYLPDQRAL
jgi:hypothetical protein